MPERDPQTFQDSQLYGVRENGRWRCIVSLTSAPVTLGIAPHVAENACIFSLRQHNDVNHMTFHETEVAGVIEFRLEPKHDERGFFARSWCQKEFESYGLNPKLVQCDVSFNALKGTLRGMHYQVPPYLEIKLVRCTRGAIYDVVVDLPAQSRTFKKRFFIRCRKSTTQDLSEECVGMTLHSRLPGTQK